MVVNTNKSGVDINLQPSRAEAVDISSVDHSFDQPRTLYVGVTGDIKVILWGTDGTNGDTITYKNVTVGDFPRLIKTVVKVGTTATELISEY